MKEVWKYCYGDLYSISNLGRVKSNLQTRSRRKGILKPYICNGYLRINLYDLFGNCKKEYIHRLVAKEFIKNPNNYKYINHIDCNKQNNSVDNLEWCTQEQNIQESIKNNLQVRVKQVHIKHESGWNYIFPTMKKASLFMFNDERKLSRLKERYGNIFKYQDWYVKVGDENVIN